MEHEKFIKGLEKEHVMIEKAFKKLEPIIEAKGIRDTAYVLEIIEQLKTILINHLRDEDNKFYPAMRRKAIELKQDALLPALDIFIDGMKDISKNIFDFISRYENEKAIAADETGFINGIIAVRAALMKRISTEEKTLYYIYKAYHNL